MGRRSLQAPQGGSTCGSVSLREVSWEGHGEQSFSTAVALSNLILQVRIREGERKAAFVCLCFIGQNVSIPVSESKANLVQKTPSAGDPLKRQAAEAILQAIDEEGGF